MGEQSFPETDLTWLCPRLLRQPVRGAAFNSHRFESCNLGLETKDLKIFKDLIGITVNSEGEAQKAVILISVLKSEKTKSR